MANNKSIQLLRSRSTSNSNVQNTVLLDGQPFFDITNNKLYIGDGTNSISGLEKIGRENYIPKIYSDDQSDSSFASLNDLTFSLTNSIHTLQIGDLVIVAGYAIISNPAFDTPSNGLAAGSTITLNFTLRGIYNIVGIFVTPVKSDNGYTYTSVKSNSSGRVVISIDKIYSAQCKGITFIAFGYKNESTPFVS